MSYCRFAWNGSEMYVYEGQRGIECCGCRLSDQWFTTSEPEEMIKHHALHRRAGHFVPESAILALWEDVPGARRPTRPEPEAMTRMTLMLELARLNAALAVIEKREERLLEFIAEPRSMNEIVAHRIVYRPGDPVFYADSVRLVNAKDAPLVTKSSQVPVRYRIALAPLNAATAGNTDYGVRITSFTERAAFYGPFGPGPRWPRPPVGVHQLMYI